MKKKGLKQVLIHIPMPALAILFGLIAAIAVWLIIDPIQTRAINNIFETELKEQLEIQARESLARFDSFMQYFINTTRLLAHHRRMAEYLEPVFWFPSVEKPLIYYQIPPLWLAGEAIKNLPIRPSHALLIDDQKKIREIYFLNQNPLPSELPSELNHLNMEQQKAYITDLNHQLYFLIAEKVQDVSYNPMGALVLLVPIDSHFLAVSQQRSSASNIVVALVDSDEQKILVSSQSNRLHFSSLDALRADYSITAQSFFDYGDSPLNLVFATLLAKDIVEATRQRILSIERRHRLTGVAIVGVIFIWLFIWISNRISRLLIQVGHISNQALKHIQQPFDPMSKRGNQLLLMEEWISHFTQAMMQKQRNMEVLYQAELKKRDALKTAVLDASLDPIITINSKGKIIDFNPTAENTFGYRQNEAVGQLLTDLIFEPHSKHLFNQLLYRCLKRKRSRKTLMPNLSIMQARNKEGRSFPVEVAIKSLRLDRSWLFTTYIRDISERERQAQEIISLAAFPAESPMPILRINRIGLIIYANKASQPLLNYWQCAPYQIVPFYWQKLINDILYIGRSQEMEIQTKEGIYSLLLVPILNLNYVNLYARNITAMRRAEEEARHRQNELIHVSRLSTMGEIATGIAHELNQPLSAIVNFAKGSVHRIRNKNYRGLIFALEQIAKQANRAGMIIKSLRQMVSKKPTVKKNTDLNSLIQDSCILIAYQRQKLKIRTEFNPYPHPVRVRVDPIQIEQVILNIMRNAMDDLKKRPPDNRIISIQTGYEKNYAFIRIADNGFGMDQNTLQQLFDPFFTTKEEGMGVGLSISQTIMNEHNGQIIVESQLNQGSVFYLKFPIYDF